MPVQLNHTRLLRYAGLSTWAMVGLPLLYVAFGAGVSPDDLSEDSFGPQSMSYLGWAAYLLFGLSYAWLTHGLGRRSARPVEILGLLLLTASAIGVSYYNRSGLGSVLLMTAACLLPWLLSLRAGIAWLIASQFAVMPVFVYGLHFPVFEALMQSLLYTGFSVFVFATSLIARQQADAREEQRRLNAELRATRLLLAESARVNERTRISRELHDLLGHHLTALSLNLEVAGHLAEGRAKEHVSQAHTLARLLLTDVREAVSQLREGGAMDLSVALRPLAENVPSLDIHMDIESPLTIDDPERAHVLLRCTQEIITNAVRHSGARHLWIDARRDNGAIVVTARDDGRGADLLVAGNGLRGMRERLAQQGGTLDIDTRPGDGFRLRLVLPIAAAPAVQGVAA
ncbi:sensor histidine kinase [Lysobacter sp. TY2-98]|uniref:sensor histidine kinase n=1 Tax=Lysobacter sp. TY2-98 TaxID=2290922 RepID=UPI000E20A6CA|nr:sensor histidine kinase [Lysobacter sp. TY2-98]AXK72385.1 sensor histidine kinase [Lysobacter sp. TY2-98]